MSDPVVSERPVYPLKSYARLIFPESSAQIPSALQTTLQSGSQDGDGAGVAVLPWLLGVRLHGGSSRLPAPHEYDATLQGPPDEEATHVQGSNVQWPL